MDEVVKKATMTEAEFAELVGVSAYTIGVLRRQGKVPHCLIGHRIVRYKPEHVEQFLASVERGTLYQAAGSSVVRFGAR